MTKKITAYWACTWVCPTCDKQAARRSAVYSDDDPSNIALNCAFCGNIHNAEIVFEDEITEKQS